MSKILNISCIEYNSQGMCTLFLQEGTFEFISDAETIYYILSEAKTFFKDHPGGVMTIDLEKEVPTSFIDRDGISITLENQEVKEVSVEDKPIEVDNIKGLTKYLDNAITNNSKGLFNLIKRLADMDRRNSIQDLITFLANSELPITEEGNILGYKILKQEKDAKDFVDFHTGMVHQQPGDRVWMNPDHVTFDKTQHCSEGLHVCSLGYLNGFYSHGNSVICLVRVHPEDIVSIPNDCDYKVRTSGYDILDIINTDETEILLTASNKNTPYSENQVPKFIEQLKKAINEEYPEPKRDIFLRVPKVQNSEDIVTTEIEPAPEPEKKSTKKKTKVKEVLVQDNRIQKVKKDKIDKLAAEINIISLVPKINDKSITKDEAQQLWDYKQNHNVSWKDLGIDDKQRKKLGRIIGKY